MAEITDDLGKLAAQLAGVDNINDINRQNFFRGAGQLGASKQHTRRAFRGLKKSRRRINKGDEFTFNDNGTFGINDSEGLGLRGSGTRKGNTVGFSAGDLVGAGNDVSNLAGLLKTKRSDLVNKERDNALVQQEDFVFDGSIDPNFQNDNPNLTDKEISDIVDSNAADEEVPDDITGEYLAFPVRDRNAPGGSRTILRRGRPTVAEEDRGPLSRKYPELFQEFLDDDANGALTQLLLDEENGEKATPEGVDERFRRWAIANKFDEFGGAEASAQVQKGETTAGFHYADPANAANVADFNTPDTNAGSLINAGELVVGARVVKGGFNLGKKGFRALKKLFTKTPKKFTPKGLLTEGKIKGFIGNTKPQNPITGTLTPKPITGTPIKPIAVKPVATPAIQSNTLAAQLNSRLSNKVIQSEIKVLESLGRKRGVLSDGTRIKKLGKTGKWGIFTGAGVVGAAGVVGGGDATADASVGTNIYTKANVAENFGNVGAALNTDGVSVPQRRNPGVKLNADKNVKPVGNGVVTAVSLGKAGQGATVIVENEDGSRTVYTGLSNESLKVKKGQVVDNTTIMGDATNQKQIMLSLWDDDGSGFRPKDPSNLLLRKGGKIKASNLLQYGT